MRATLLFNSEVSGATTVSLGKGFALQMIGSCVAVYFYWYTV